MFDDLPPEMAVKILLRLPVTNLIRSTSVSKTWYSLITNPNFISAQISLSISCCNESDVFVVPRDISDQKYCYLISAETGVIFDKYKIPFSTWSGTMEFVGSLHGLLLLNCHPRPFTCPHLYLWNPSLRKYKSIGTSYFKKFFNQLPQHCSYALGLGFHQPTHDYRVVRVLYYKGNLTGKRAPRAEIFSLRMNKWREVKNPIVRRLVREFGTSVNNTVYWIDRRSPETYSDEVWILSFDFNNEVFGQFKLPDDVRYCLGDTANFKLMKFKGSLSVCVFNIDVVSNWMVIQPCCIWLMSHEDGNVSWTIPFRVVHMDFGLPDIRKLGFPLNITNSGTLLMMSLSPPAPGHHVPGLLSCNLKSMQYKYLGFGNPLKKNVLVPADVDTSFIESLVMHVGQDELLKSEKAVLEPYESPAAK